ncbi:hypothetical protein EsH8_VII_000668 [Colletotrichum jinshuiense]
MSLTKLNSEEPRCRSLPLTHSTDILKSSEQKKERFLAIRPYTRLGISHCKPANSRHPSSRNTSASKPGRTDHFQLDNKGTICGRAAHNRLLLNGNSKTRTTASQQRATLRHAAWPLVLLMSGTSCLDFLPHLSNSRIL